MSGWAMCLFSLILYTQGDSSHNLTLPFNDQIMNRITKHKFSETPKAKHVKRSLFMMKMEAYASRIYVSRYLPCLKV